MKEVDVERSRRCRGCRDTRRNLRRPAHNPVVVCPRAIITIIADLDYGRGREGQLQQPCVKVLGKECARNDRCKMLSISVRIEGATAKTGRNVDGKSPQILS